MAQIAHATSECHYDRCRAAFAAHKARRRALEKRIEALEQRESESAKRATSLRWRGLWQPESEYQGGDCVTYDGQLWFVHQTVRGDPPATTKKFQLMARQ